MLAPDQLPVQGSPRHRSPLFAWLWSASPARTAIETVLFLALGLAFLLGVLLLYNAELVLSLIVLGELVALLLAVRLRVPQGRFSQQLNAEIRPASLLALGMGVLETGAALSIYWNGTFDLRIPVIAVLGLVLPLLHALSYLALRAVFAVLRWWNKLRHRRLLWALTHDQLVVVLVLMVVFGVGAGLVVLSYGLLGDVANGTLSGDSLYGQILNLSVVGTFYVALIVLMLIGAFPLAILLSFVLVRRIVRRVERLAEATEALRRGNYAARVDVVGQDEISRLQTDFNTMASDLDRTLRELQGERDRVAGLLQAQRELTASVSHELRTPVATQRSYLEAVLRGEPALPQHIRAELAVVERETHRLQRLIDDLFTLSRAEIGRLMLRVEPLDLGAIAERTAATLAPIAWQNGRVAVEAQTPPTPTLALADEQRFEQVLRNLVLNGIRHTPAGGIVAIIVSVHATHVHVQVNDTGSGIAPEDLPHIWNRFYRANADRATDQSSAGLGLTLVKELTEAMGGSVAVESVVGAGSSFTIRLPSAPPPEDK